MAQVLLLFLVDEDKLQYLKNASQTVPMIGPILEEIRRKRLQTIYNLTIKRGKVFVSKRGSITGLCILHRASGSIF